MAVLQFGGAEVGSTAEHYPNASNASIVTTPKRTGEYALRLQATAAQAYAEIPAILSGTSIGSSYNHASLWIGFGFYVTTLPGATIDICSLRGASGIHTRLQISSSGQLSITGPAGGGASGSTLATDKWYYIELRGQSSDTGSYDVRINGTSDMSGTMDQLISGNFTGFWLGNNSTNTTYLFYYDDWYVDDAAFQGSTAVLPEVRMLRPNANGDGVGWTGAPTDDYTQVDEVPPGSDGTEDTSYIEATAAQDNQYSTFHMESTSTRGVTGTIKAVMGFVRAKTGSTTGTSTVSIRMRNNTTNVDTNVGELTTGYLVYKILQEVDPNGGGAWTSGGVDTVQIGMLANTIAQTQRFTVAYAMVLATVTNPSPTVTPTTASLTITTFAPTVEVSAGDVTVTPTTASLALTAFAPTVLTPVLVTPTTATLTTTTFAPVIDLRVTIPVASLALTTFAPTVSTPVLVTPTTASLTLTTFAPSVAGGTGTTLTPTTASLTLTTFAPTVLTPVLATPATASLTLTSFAPTVTVDVRVTPTTATLTLTAFAPTVLTPVLVTPTTAALTLTTFAPGVVGGAGLTVVPATATLTLTTFAPTVTAAAPILVTPLTANLITTTFAPTVLTPRLVTPTTAALILTTFAPTIFLPILVMPTTAALVLTTFAPDAYASQPISETYIRMMGFDVEQLVALGFDRAELEASGTDRNRMDLRGREL